MEIVQSGPGRNRDGSPVVLVLGSPGDLSPVFRGFDGACRWCASGVWHTSRVHDNRVMVTA